MAVTRKTVKTDSYDILSISCDLNSVLEMLDVAEKQCLLAAEKGMAVVTLDLLGEGMRNAPILTGNLRGSGSARINGRAVGHTVNDSGETQVVKDDFTPAPDIEITGEVGFDCEYAMDQHENLTYEHPRGGKAKYLEDPLKEKIEQYSALIAEAMRGEL